MERMGPQVEMMATYRITVQGAPGEEWSTNEYGLVISVEESDEDELPVTILTDQLPNQDALRQLLNSLYDQRPSLLSLECLEEDESQSWQALNNGNYLSGNA